MLRRAFDSSPLTSDYSKSLIHGDSTQNEPYVLYKTP
jgi:hypothetical protein